MIIIILIIVCMCFRVSEKAAIEAAVVLRKRLESEDAKVRNIEQKLCDKMKANEELQNQLDDAKKKCSELERQSKPIDQSWEVSRLEETVRKLQEEMKAKEELQIQLDDAKKKCSELERQSKPIDRSWDISRLEETVRKKDVYIKHLKEEADKREKSALQARQLEIDRLKGWLSDKDKTIERQKKEAEQNNEMESNFRIRLRKLQSDIDEKQREYDKLHSDFVRIMSESHNYMMKAEQKKKEVEEWDSQLAEKWAKLEADFNKEAEKKKKELREFAELFIANAEEKKQIISQGVDINTYLLSLGMYDVLRSNILYDDSFGGEDAELEVLKKKLKVNLASQKKFKVEHGGNSTYVHGDEYRRFFYSGICDFGTMVFDILSENIAAGVQKNGIERAISQLTETKMLCESYMKIRSKRHEGNVMFYTEYVNLKLEELKLTSDIHLLREKIKEDKRVERERLKEEMKAQKEFERELKRAQKDEEEARKALERAQLEAAKEQQDKEKYAKLQQQIAKLEAALKEAEERGQRMLSMAQQTRRGWVYVISNIGSFGEGVYKIGLTRRLDPMERVYELGDASVPFPFDVHAFIFSEDAPALETALHQAFEKQKLNMVNGKKEFFRVPLADIEAKVKELGYDVEFERHAYAPQFRDSVVRNL